MFVRLPPPLIAPLIVSVFAEALLTSSELVNMTGAEIVLLPLVLTMLIWAFDPPLSNVSVPPPLAAMAARVRDGFEGRENTLLFIRLDGLLFPVSRTAEDLSLVLFISAENEKFGTESQFVFHVFPGILAAH